MSSQVSLAKTGNQSVSPAAEPWNMIDLIVRSRDHYSRQAGQDLSYCDVRSGGKGYGEIMSCMTKIFVPNSDINSLKESGLAIFTHTDAPRTHLEQSADWVIPHELGHIFNSALWINEANFPNSRWREGDPQDISLKNHLVKIEQLSAGDEPSRNWIINAFSEAFTDGIGVQIAQKFGVPLSLEHWQDSTHNLHRLAKAFTCEILDYYDYMEEGSLKGPSWRLYSYLKDFATAASIHDILKEKDSNLRDAFGPFSDLPNLLSPNIGQDTQALHELFCTAFQDGYNLDLRFSTTKV